MKRSIMPFFITIILASCSDPHDSNPDDNISQTEKDRYIGYTIIDTVSQIYNINLAGRPTGAQNITTTCPIGGNVAITGTTGYAQNNGITTVDLIFTMTGCNSQRHLSNNIDTSVILNGTITFKGSFNTATNYNATNYQSESLKIKGTIKSSDGEEATIDESCKFAATITNDTVSGTICSRSFSY